MISVVIAVYNAADCLDECLRSIATQTIGFDAIEVVAVDDGSTDGSGELLAEWAARHPNVHALRQANSGAPGGPRNRGIDASTGEYLFFADPDDYLGPEAFERMVAMARRNDSDIVLGRIAGVGRIAPTRPFRRSVENGDVLSTQAVWSLTAQKLFRRSLIVDNGLRFAEGVRLAEEQPLVVPAYFLAKTISVVADYDCYYLVLRSGHKHLTRQQPDPERLFGIVGDAMRTVTENTKPGPDRDALLGRWVSMEILHWFRRWFPDLPADARERYIGLAADLLDEYVTPEALEPMPRLDRIRATLIRRRRPDELLRLAHFARSGTRAAPVIEGDRVYAGYPYFREPAYGMPDSYYDITGELALDHCRAEVTATPAGVLRVMWRPAVPALREPGLAWSVVLTGPAGREYEVAGHQGPDGPEATVDLAIVDGGARIPDGRWTAHTKVRGSERRAMLAIGDEGTAEAHPELGAALAAGVPVDISLTANALVIKAGEAVRPRAELAPEGVAWRPGRGGHLTVAVLCRWPVAGQPTLYLTRGAGGPILAVPATQQPGGAAPGVLVSADLDARALARAGLTPGRWQCTIGPADAPPDRRVPVHAPGAGPTGRLVARSPIATPLWSMAWLEPAGRQRVLTLVIADWRHVARRLRQRGGRALGRLRRT